MDNLDVVPIGNIRKAIKEAEWLASSWQEDAARCAMFARLKTDELTRLRKALEDRERMSASQNGNEGRADVGSEELADMSDTAEVPFASRWRHKKTGHVYKVRLGAVTIEATMTPAVVYAREDLTPGLWVRPTAEFLDGRFERIEDRRACGCTYDEACICDDPDFN